MDPAFETFLSGLVLGVVALGFLTYVSTPFRSRVKRHLLAWQRRDEETDREERETRRKEEEAREELDRELGSSFDRDAQGDRHETN